ncbi:MAG TPA: hypothetical protein VMT30_07500 [Candidatus Saccharimonadia bacterium]|nr:hypothetical protein [Candidatus Saccharimonadia bacterium]
MLTTIKNRAPLGAFVFCLLMAIGSVCIIIVEVITPHPRELQFFALLNAAAWISFTVITLSHLPRPRL